jgi:hypothetical protein
MENEKRKMKTKKWIVWWLKSYLRRSYRRCGHSSFPISHFSFLILLAASCGQQPKTPVTATTEENREAKAMLQGIWLDSETQEVVLRADGDTIYYADGTSQPAYFRIVGDSIELGPNTYRIIKQTEHNFWFENHAGDEVQLVKPDESSEEQPQFTSEEPQVITTTEVVNVDSVVMYGGQRYHWYITVNPTRYRVTRTTYTPDGVAVEKVFYDNIIHVSVFKGNQRLFSRDFDKKAYSADIPEEFLSQSILGNIRYSHTDPRGFHFYSTICIPDGESCYMEETVVSFDGKLTLKLVE